MYMLTRVISLSEEAYEALKKLKRNDESFSDVIMRLIRGLEARSLIDFAGKWVGNDIDDVFKKILQEREKIEAREALF